MTSNLAPPPASGLVISEDDALAMRWVPVQWARSQIYEDNLKLHDVEGLMLSIARNGFRDPPAWDSTLEAINFGNGRTEVLALMEEDKEQYWAVDDDGQPWDGVFEVLQVKRNDKWVYALDIDEEEEQTRDGCFLVRGTAIDEEGNWWMPMLFGVDSADMNAAEAFVLDHNLLTVTGGQLSVVEAAKMFKPDEIIAKLQDLHQRQALPVAVSKPKLDLLLQSLQQMQEEREANSASGSSDPMPTPGDADVNELNQDWGIIVYCKDEEQQIDYLNRFMEEGIECKALV